MYPYFNIVAQLENVLICLFSGTINPATRLSPLYSAMSFGYGVGDILAISALALKVVTAYKDAPEDYRNISDEVESLHIIINKAAKHFESTTLSDNSRQEGQKVLKGCKNVLEDLDTLIEKYNSLASASKSTSQVLKRIKLGTEDIATLRVRLISNTTLLNGFIQRFDILPNIIKYISSSCLSLYSCDSNEMRARLDNILGLHRTTSRDSMVSLTGSINTKQAYKKFIKGLFAIGVTADMINDKEKEIQEIFKPQPAAASCQIDDSTLVDPNQLPQVGNASNKNQVLEVGNSSNQDQLLEVGNSPNPGTSPISPTSTKNQGTRSRFGWARPPIDFLVGPLMLAAAETGNTKRLASTLEYVRNIDFADDQKRTALHKAAAKGHKDMVQLLLLKGASIEALGEYDRTPLDYAAWRGHTSTVELLLSKGASIEATSKTKRSPLHYAAWSGHTSIVELLLLKGASIEAMDRDNRTPLNDAASRGRTSTVELLLLKGAPIEAMGKCDRTSLSDAASGGHTSTVELLLSKGASIEATDESKWTPLHYAASNDHTSTVKLLLSKGASIDAMCDRMRTPLHYAAWYGNTSTVELLLSKGASISARNNDNQTPLDLATSKNYLGIARLLKNKSAQH